MLRKFFTLFSFILVLALAPGAALAQETDNQEENWIDDYKFHPALQKLKDEGAQITYLGHAYGLDGWVVEKDGVVQFSYTTPDNRGVVNGYLFGPDGQSHTQQQIQKVKEGIDVGRPGENTYMPTKPSEILYREVEDAAWFEVGEKDAPTLYTFVDPICDTCHEFWESLEDPIKTGMVKVRLIPVAASPEGLVDAAAILSSSNPAASWRRQVTGVRASLSKSIDPAKKKAIEENIKIMYKWGFGFTPFSVYKNLEGHVKLLSTKPDNLMLLLSDIGLGQ